MAMITTITPGGSASSKHHRCTGDERGRREESHGAGLPERAEEWIDIGSRVAPVRPNDGARLVVLPAPPRITAGHAGREAATLRRVFVSIRSVGEYLR